MNTRDENVTATKLRKRMDQVTEHIAGYLAYLWLEGVSLTVPSTVSVKKVEDVATLLLAIAVVFAIVTARILRTVFTVRWSLIAGRRWRLTLWRLSDGYEFLQFTAV